MYWQRFKTEEERFWEKVTKLEGDDACWVWQNNLQYTYFRKNGKNVKANRYSYELHFGPFPPEMDVCHTCDNGACVNPAHLFLGTHTDNMRDKAAKGRSHYPRGAKNGRAKLTAEQVQQIRSEYAAGGISQTALARRYGMTQATISGIVLGKNWK